MREIILDTETTGLNFKTGDRIIEVGCVELINHIATGNNLQFYCSVEKKIEESATNIHGLTNEFLSKHPPFEDNVKKLLNFIKDDILIIHNAEFDLGFLNNELKLINLKPIKNQVLDTVTLARKKLNSRIANLDYLCKRFSIDASARTLHGALLDCHLLAEVYLELMGGKQTSLELSEHKSNKKQKEDKNLKKRQKILKISITDEQINLHKKHVRTIKDNLWEKLDY